MSTLLNTSVGQAVPAELPNITGSTYPRGNVGEDNTAVKNGAFKLGSTVAGDNIIGYEHIRTGYTLEFDASRCSSIYKDSATTVVPESLITNFYIRY